jgi:hypothetical protein
MRGPHHYKKNPTNYKKNVDIFQEVIKYTMVATDTL